MQLHLDGTVEMVTAADDSVIAAQRDTDAVDAIAAVLRGSWKERTALAMIAHIVRSVR